MAKFKTQMTFHIHPAIKEEMELQAQERRKRSGGVDSVHSLGIEALGEKYKPRPEIASKYE